ncbi:hypothetical protein O6H91_04G079200 [Diphasiastrum complanatum]|uniref:Uncharacterized protein n=1 Tax=Diphasiastrum complanatum TaxID=34168 RepID=A0ACC2DYT3_DIPCM|nr:hypothetical protein O6H91_04G079200 [Diphasiastrum complanatum]
MQFKSFDDFWVFYLTQHRKLSTRRWHCCGTSIAVLFIVAAAVVKWWCLLFAGVLVGYGFAWYSHFFVEGNRPATFGHPIWSFLCDFKMLGLTLIGGINKEIKRIESIE